MLIPLSNILTYYIEFDNIQLDIYQGRENGKYSGILLVLIVNIPVDKSLSELLSTTSCIYFIQYVVSCQYFCTSHIQEPRTLKHHHKKRTAVPSFFAFINKC